MAKKLTGWELVQALEQERIGKLLTKEVRKANMKKYKTVTLSKIKLTECDWLNR